MSQNNILRLKEVVRKTALSKSTIYQLINLGMFPEQINLGLRSVGWLEAEIEGWLEDRIQQSRKLKLGAAK